MQSGTTGINTTRVYNPIKQAQDHDPLGKFVRRWLPAMLSVPNTWLFEPWKMPENVRHLAGVVQDFHVPRPPLELASATREAKARLHSRRQQDDVKAGKKAVIEKHASQKRFAASPPKRKVQHVSSQLGFDF